MLDLLCSMIIADHIIAVIVPCQCPRADSVPFTAPFKPQRLVHGQLHILKGNHLLFSDRPVDLIYQIINALIICLYTVGDKNLPL